MFYFLIHPVIGTLFGIGAIGWLGAKAIGGLFGRLGDNAKAPGNWKSPFPKIDVKPVSEGDRICYALFLNGKYSAHIENKRKKAQLVLEADSELELQRKIEETFRAWAVTGRKKPGWR